MLANPYVQIINFGIYDCRKKLARKFHSHRHVCRRHSTISIALHVDLTLRAIIGFLNKIKIFFLIVKSIYVSTVVKS